MADTVNLTVTQEDEAVNLSILYEGDTIDLTIAQVGIKGDPGTVTDEQIETGYNNQVSQVSTIEKIVGTETDVRRFAPKDVKDMIETHAGVGQNEEDINGTRLTASVTGTYAIDWDAASVFVLTMTGDTTFSDTNLPTGANSKVITVELTGDFSATLPTYWEARPSNDSYDGTVRNEITVNCKNGTTSSENVTFSLENLAT